MYSYNTLQEPTAPPPQKGYMLSWFLAAVAARKRMLHTLAAVAAHVPAYSMRSLRGHHSASVERPTFLNAGSCTMSQAGTHAACAPPTDVWPLRVPQVCDTCTLAAAAACALSTCAASPLWRSSSAASLGTTRSARFRRWAQRGHSLKRRACVGWASTEIPVSQHCEGPGSMACTCRCGGSVRLPLWRFAAPGMGPLTPLAAPSHAALAADATVAMKHLANAQSVAPAIRAEFDPEAHAPAPPPFPTFLTAGGCERPPSEPGVLAIPRPP
jgi:hypothetical protein